MSEAPTNRLPTWADCRLRVDNKKYLDDNKLDGDDLYADALLPNPIHKFIYEYDDSDAYKSAWFLHRLERLIEFVEERAKAKQTKQND